MAKRVFPPEWYAHQAARRKKAIAGQAKSSNGGKTEVSLQESSAPRMRNELSRRGVSVDAMEKSNGVFTARRVFFYTNGKHEGHFRDEIKRAMPEADFIDGGQVDKPFRGGASARESSHWYVKFKIKKG